MGSSPPPAICMLQCQFASSTCALATLCAEVMAKILTSPALPESVGQSRGTTWISSAVTLAVRRVELGVRASAGDQDQDQHEFGDLGKD
jgi:hypothetical protein